MRATTIAAFTAAFILTGWQPAAAEQPDYPTLALAAPEMTLDLGPRAVGRAGACTAEVRGADSLNWNPAGLAGVAKFELEGMHAFYLQDSMLETLTYAQPAWQGGGVGVQAVYVNYGILEHIEVEDGLPVTVGEFNPGTWIFSLGVGHKIISSLAMGVAGKYYRYQMMGDFVTTWAGDAGLQWSGFQDSLFLGVAARNMGTAVAGFSLPVTYKAGAAYRLPFGLLEHDRWSVEADADFTRSIAQPVFRAGTAYQFKAAAIRAGYIFRDYGALSGPAGLTLGAGLQGPVVSLDYAVAFYGVLGTVHHFSAGVMF